MSVCGLLRVPDEERELADQLQMLAYRPLLR
jgi:hypothetical protein